jgi:hypothetical protein
MTKRTFMNTMRALFAAAALAGLAARAAAGVSPQMINFQGRLVDASNAPRNGTFDMTFSIYSVPTGGTALWTETQTGVPVDNGVFNAALGSVNPLTVGVFNGAAPYLGVTVAPDAEMTPRQPLLMTPLSFRALLADDLAPGNTSYVQVAVALQTGAVFHVSSATVEGPLLVTGASTFTAAGNQTYSLDTSSGLRVQGGTLRVEGAGGVDAAYTIKAATLSATVSLQLPSAGPRQTRGVMTFDPTLNLVYVGTGTSHTTLADLDSVQTLTNKTLDSGSNAVIDATRLQTRAVSNAAPSDGMSLRWDASGSQWAPSYAADISVLPVPFTPGANVTITADTIYLTPVVVPGNLSLNQIRYRVTTRVVGSTGDVGLYDDSGNLVASGGASSADFGSNGAKVVTMQNAPVSVTPGQYYLALVCDNVPAIRSANLAAASAGVVKGLGTITLSPGAGTTLPSSVSLGSVVDGYIVPFMGANQ